MTLMLPQPGPRKQAIMSLVPASALAAEVGADHGIVSAHLLTGGLCERMVVTDISAASLEKAKRLFSRHGLTERAEFRVADGFKALREPAGAIVIAGMGARTIVDILEQGCDRIGHAALVLQPNPDPPALRRWLYAHGFCVDAERLVREGRRFYVVMRAVRGQADASEKELLLGPCLLRDRPALLGEYLAWRHGCLLREQKPGNEQAIQWIVEEESAG